MALIHATAVLIALAGLASSQGAITNPCGNGWTLGPAKKYCYYVNTDYTSWSDAENACLEHNGHLTSIHSDNEANFLKSLANSKNAFGYWIGLHKSNEGAYVWTDNTRNDYKRWGQDVTSQGSSDTCVFSLENVWYCLGGCNRKLQSICKKKTLKPCDSGNPYNGWYLGPNRKYCYSLTRVKLDWKSASKYCQSQDVKGFLTSIHNEEENNFVLSLQKLNPMRSVWIGLYEATCMPGKKRWFVWTDATTKRYVKWAPPSEPNNLKGDENCVEQFGDGNWNDNSCSRRLYGVCKRLASIRG